MKLDEPIITSLLDNDLYKFNMGQLVFHDFSEAVVTYGFINRGKTQFPEGFAKALNWQIELLAVLKMVHSEKEYLRTIPGLRPSYIEWLSNYQFDPSEVVATQEGGDLSIFVKGSWFRTIYWEVVLMSIVSELYFKMTGQKMDDKTLTRLHDKNERMSEVGCLWNDFGTRRRFSYEAQDNVVRISKDYKGFLGTSNVHFAHKHGVKPVGTSAHEMVMALSALYGPALANKMWSIHWSQHFNG